MLCCIDIMYPSMYFPMVIINWDQRVHRHCVQSWDCSLDFDRRKSGHSCLTLLNFALGPFTSNQLCICKGSAMSLDHLPRTVYCLTDPQKCFDCWTALTPLAALDTEPMGVTSLIINIPHLDLEWHSKTNWQEESNFHPSSPLENIIYSKFMIFHCHENLINLQYLITAIFTGAVHVASLFSVSILDELCFPACLAGCRLGSPDNTSRSGLSPPAPGAPSISPGPIPVPVARMIMMSKQCRLH